MRKGMGVYGPDEIKLLQEIFDAVWLQLQRVGRVHNDDDNVREWISACVILLQRKETFSTSTV